MNIANEKKALLIIDVTNFCCSPKCESNKHGEGFRKIRKMVPSLVSFIKSWKKLSLGPVFFINCVKWDKKHIAANLVELYKDPNCTYYTKDPSDFPEEFYKIKSEKGDYIITKNSYDAFVNKKFIKILKKEDVKYLVIAGVFGEACVHSTIQGGFSAGYNFIILKDLIETIDAKKRQDLQKLLKQYLWPINFGKTISSKQFLKIYDKKNVQ